MKRSSLPPSQNQPQVIQQQRPGAPPLLVASGGAEVRDVTQEMAARRAAAVQQPTPPGERHIQPHVPRPAGQPGMRHVRDTSGTGTVADVQMRQRPASPMLRDRTTAASSFQDRRGTTADRQMAQPYLQASQAQPPPASVPSPGLRMRAAPQTRIQSPTRPAEMFQPSLDAQPIVGVTVVITHYARPDVLRLQLEALMTASVVPAQIWILVNGHGVMPIDEAALMTGRYHIVRSNGNLGGWPRLSATADMNTDYVLILDDDCVPGSDWLRRAVDRLDETARVAEMVGDALEHAGAVIIACEGGRFSVDDPFSLEVAGSGEHEEVVDVGAGGWIGPRAVFAEINASRRPPGIVGMGLFLGAAAAAYGIATIVLPTPIESNAGWGSIAEPASPSLRDTEIYAEAYASAYEFCRSQGWAPMVLRQGDYVEGAIDQVDQVDQDAG